MPDRATCWMIFVTLVCGIYIPFETISSCHAKLTILWPPEYSGYQCQSVQFYYRGINYDFGPLNNSKLVFPSRPQVIQGAFVFLVPSLPTQPIIRSYMQQGAIGVVFAADSSIPGRDMFATDGQDDSDITIPVVQIGPLSANSVFRNFSGDSMLINLTSDGNPWRDIYHSPAMVFVQIIVTASGVVVAALMIWKIILFYRAYRFEYKIPLICLLFDCLACLERAIYFAIDPRNVRQVFDKSIEVILFYISIPFTISVAILITFFWHDALIEYSVRTETHISKLRIPFLVTIIAVYLIHLLTMVIAVIFYSTYYALMYAINALLLVIVSLGSSIYYVVIAVRVIKWLKQSPLRNERPVKKITGTVIASAISLFLFAAINIIGIIPQVINTPSGYVFWFCSLHIALNCITLTHVLSFHPQNASRSKRQSLNDDNKTQTTKLESIEIKNAIQDEQEE